MTSALENTTDKSKAMYLETDENAIMPESSITPLNIHLRNSKQGNTKDGNQKGGVGYKSHEP